MALSSASVDRFPNEPGQPQTDTYSTRLDPGTKAKVQASADTQYATTDLRRAHTVAHGRNTKETATIGSRTTRERLATSLLRVKDSHEILRKRSFKRPDTSQAPRDAAVGAREPNHFTVGNVGQNGKIFLRPIRNPPTKEPFPAPSIPSPSQSRQEHFAHGRGAPESDEPSRWSNSQLSELRPDLIPEESCEDGDSVNTESAHSQYHGLPHHRPRKAHSFSTISEQRSESRAGRAGELRIYIDRADNRPKTANEPSQRALDDAIPRYRLDLPRSNLDNETALHSSIYSRTSLSDIMRTSRLPREYWIGTLASDAYLRNPERPSFVGSVFSGAGAIELPQSSAVSENPVFYELKEPIEPAIFETLVSKMDKESVVRYASGTKDISAATPARIVAQISSASFMDYELVSDFFLTFRSYISTSTLLALLLARLRWAINRLQDDGRIIRIRTFAALRHWILNYFVDDFVPEYDLRGHFCETINSMYDDVKSRQGGGMSDLKILIDLKRCWYGKSSLYWDFPNDHDVFQSPDVAILPGDREADTLETAVGGDLLALNLRRSFEDAIAQFAQIPDDDDGGVESTLLKLEGKWHGASVEDAEASEWLRQGRGSAGHHNFANSDALARRRQTFFGDGLTYSQVQGRIVPQRPYSDSIAESEDSYSSIPLLERGLSDESMKKPVASRPTSHMAGPSRFQPSFSSRETSDMESSHPSIDIVKETESMKRIPRGSTLPGNPSGSRKPTGRLSGLSSGISIDMIDSQEAAEQRFSIDTQSMTDSSLGIPPHPLAHPPSPPMTVQNTRSVGSWTTPLNPVLFQAQPLTPDPSPRNKMAQQANTRPVNTQQVSGDVLSQSEKGRRFPEPLKIAGPEHVPFVLSCESHVLAQQLTLVEMAALSEVDWRDLVDMRWSSGSPTMLSWVQFLMEEEHRGIDLVVGRFNLMVRWVLSEIVLTQDIHERARTIAKFIHTAAHARRMCNYATMLQIAIALSSTDCSRLQATWDLVPVADKRLLKDMESLTQPIRNFHELRLEMEMANAQDGCIPFVGLYVHDLTYNAQKPARVTTQDGESLINFERYRTTAKIVKSLLRLIDASTRYRFEPVPGIIERCLWIASLSEEQVQLRSKQLE
nr:hypothetical protein ANI_1_2794024 [Aspergillus niger CBS 513.88]|eukprot:XP_001399970.2 hypothetical protein ANI_1_2794024 [Aspergillus niger CBS 513.88]